MRGQRKTWQSRLYDVVNNVYAGALVTGAFMIASALYSHLGPIWGRPVVNALITGAIVSGFLLTIRALLSLPTARPRITPDNCGFEILQWLHRFNLEVKTLPSSDDDFLFRVTTDGQRRITIGRGKESFSDYLTVRSTVTWTEKQLEQIAVLSDYERLKIKLELELELARMVMGYQTNDWAKEGCNLFKRYPITEFITEETVIGSGGGVWKHA